MSPRKSSRLQKKNNEEPQNIVAPTKNNTRKEPIGYYILLYKCENTMITIYVTNTNTNINNIDAIKTFEIKPNVFATLQYVKKCCKQVYTCMSKINNKIYTDDLYFELTNKLSEKLGYNINTFEEDNDDVIYDYKKEEENKQKEEEKKKLEEENRFKFDWDIDELTTTTWDLIDWNEEQIEEEEPPIQEEYDSDEDRNIRMTYKPKYIF